MTKTFFADTVLSLNNFYDNLTTCLTNYCFTSSNTSDNGTLQVNNVKNFISDKFNGTTVILNSSNVNDFYNLTLKYKNYKVYDNVIYIIIKFKLVHNYITIIDLSLITNINGNNVPISIKTMYNNFNYCTLNNNNLTIQINDFTVKLQKTNTWQLLFTKQL